MKQILFITRFIFCLFLLAFSNFTDVFLLFANESIRSQILDLIPDNTVREQKIKEMNNLKKQVNNNLTDLRAYTKYFNRCLNDFYSCSERSCGTGLKGCVSVNNPLLEDKIINLSLECYPVYRNCIVSTISNSINSSNDITVQILKQINSEKMVDMAVNRVINTLTDEYVKLMKKTCEDAEGFYYNGICTMLIASQEIEGFLKQANDNNILESINKATYRMGFILPGVALSSDNIIVKNSNENTITKPNETIFNITKTIINNSLVRQTYLISKDFYKINNNGRKNIIPIENFVFIPKGWDTIIGDSCFSSYVFDNVLTHDPLEQIIKILNDRPECSPSGFIKKKINTVMRQNWSNMFKKSL